MGAVALRIDFETAVHNRAIDLLFLHKQKLENTMIPQPDRTEIHPVSGEMGARWGVNRTVAQIHALLFLANEPLNAEQIVETPGVARSNVSNSLKELQGSGLVKVAHVMGDRCDHLLAKDPA